MGTLKKLKGRSLDELRLRGSQRLYSWAERRGWSARLSDDLAFSKSFSGSGLSGGASAGEFLNYFRSRTGPQFFSSFANRESTISEVNRRWPDNVERLTNRADRIANGCFDLLGLRGLSFGEPIDWHFEPVSGKRSPQVHWSKFGELDSRETGDKKIIWELNRHQHFVTLGRAYWLTGDERYARTFISHVSSWMDSNPPTIGVNWLSSLEVAFRAISWLWALHFFRDSPQLTPDIFFRLLKYLYVHARHLERYLSTYSSPNTHLTGEALGLFYLGTMLPEFVDARRWRTSAENILLGELPRHVRSDGVYFEQSSYYQRYTVDFYTHLFILAGGNRAAFGTEIAEKLQLLLDHLMYITRPDGSTPLFGDDDGGKLLFFDERPGNDFRPALSTGAALFSRADYKFVAGAAAEETLWLLGPAGLAVLDGVPVSEPAAQSVAFEEGGYYVMRDGWTPTANYLLFDCGPHGFNNGGHAHSDALSFELAANGRTLLVDPGTYTYTAMPKMRDWFRSSAAHNALTVDDQSSSESDGPFSWRNKASCHRGSWITQPRFDYITGSHNGYSRLPDSATYSRGILFLKKNYWLIRDQVSSAGDHLLKLWFHFDSGVAPLHGTHNNIQVIGENGHTTRLQLSTFAHGGQWKREQGWVSSCYGLKEEAPVFVFSVLAKGPEDFLTFILPQASGSHFRSSVREVEAIEGRAFELDFEGQHDVLVVRSFPDNTEGRIETAKLASDFEVTWARFGNRKARIPDELVLIGGHTLEIEGREILSSGKRIDYLAVSILGDQVRVEADQDSLESRRQIESLESLFADMRR